MRIFPSFIVVAIMLGALSAAGGQNVLESIRVLSTEPASFEYLFTGVTSGADGRPVLAFNHRNGRTFFARPGERLGPYRITAYESKTNRVYYPSLNDYLDKPTGHATLVAPGQPAVILEQNRPLPWPGRVAWLIKLNNGLWWNIQEEDVFLAGNKLVFVEEIAEDGVVVTAGQDPAFIRLIGAWEKDAVEQLWAQQKRDAEWEQALAQMRRQDEARAQAASGRTSYIVVDRGPHIEIRGPARFFYGTEYRFPRAYKAAATAISRDGRIVGAPIVIPSDFETRFSGVSITVP